MTIELDVLTPADADRCAELEKLLFPGDDPWSAGAFRAELAAKHNRYFAVRTTLESGVTLMIGYAGVSLLGNRFSPESEVHTIGVDPSFQRLGVGTMLLDRLLAEAEKHGGPVFLEVRTDNEPAIALYRRYGFDTVGTRRNYYQPSGADAFTMRRPAGGGAPS
ncbi:ribosomal protein S18-alanine N-acetyltransferase [Antrihabitans sp. NCIMB 15449]|uniref:Ribosomal protein S18-alanine N-acetyltransferase n=1 Tax=Antrihabitans spumae TaxID=3373370 RepID=A0ABW7JNN8_9NOCA